MIADKKICYVSTLAWPLKIYMGVHIQTISKYLNIHLVADSIIHFPNNRNWTNFTLKDISIKRKINIICDLFSLIKLYFYFRDQNFLVVHSIMPKSGLLSMFAARFAGVPFRVHTFTGQVWATKKGLSRKILILCDRLIVGCSTHILTDSPSQRSFLIAEGIVNESKISVLADGSISGVNTIRFAACDVKRNDIRAQLSISNSAIVFIFIGRLNFEKGINDLVMAFTCALEIVPNIELLVVGEDEGVYCSIISNISQKVKNKIHRIEWTDFPEHYICASDVICLPSYREGFGNVLIESAAIGLPSIASNIYGVTDAVINGRTGILHEPGNISQIALAMQHLAQNSVERKKMGQQAKKRASELFSESRLSLAYLDFIDAITADQ